MHQKTAESSGHEVISAAEAGSLAGLFAERCRRTPDKVAYRQFDRAAWVWRDHTWQEVATGVHRWRHGLRRQGLVAGDRIALWLAHSVTWVCCEQAALAEGMVVVPLYVRDNPENQAYILNDCSCRLLVVDSAEQWHQLRDCGCDLPALEQVVCVAATGPIEAGDLLRPEASWLPPDPTEGAGPHLRPEDLATIIYTSGTTGRPKGVMLSHRNILWNGEAVLQVHPSRPDDLFLSFLPLSHAFERTVGYYIPMMAGCPVAFSRSIQELAEDLHVIRPTVLISVPRIYERIAARLQDRLAGQGRMARLVFTAAVTVGFRRFEARRDRCLPGLLDRLAWPVLKRLVADRLLAGFGGRLRLAVTGGAPVQGEIARLFLGLGLPLVQGYGLTEAAPVVSTNEPMDNRPASTGRPLPGVEVRLSEGDELLVRSPGVMLGYWGQPGLTSEVLDSRGWLKTGDIARIIDGFVHIVGRSKEILVTSTGEKVSPVAMEMVLEQHPLIDQAMVVGEGRPFLTALVVVNPQAWRRMASTLGLQPDDPAALHTEAAAGFVLRTLTGRLRDFPASAQVRGVFLLDASWTIDNGLLTPTMKLKREQITTRYAGHIEEMYRKSCAL